MVENTDIAKQIAAVGESSFSKLQDLNIPPYPKYYFDAFMDQLAQTNNQELISLSKKYSYLFATGEVENSAEDISFELAKSSLNEFEQSNTNLKNISDKNQIDIGDIKNEYENIHTQKIIDTFGCFQNQILGELKRADETVKQLKLEIEKLERESHIDPLTKVYNRRGFKKDIVEIFQAIEGKRVDLFLVMLDADDFKNINDSYGHIAGDKTLIFLTKLIQNSLRKGIKVYRYGGEEFIIILNRTTLEEVKSSIARIIKEIDASKLLYKGHDIHLTISAGIACHKENDTVENLLDRADKALYQSKKDGKNCYRVNC